MSVYIKGMEMPTKCEECEWSTTDRSGFFGCRLTGNIVIRKREKDRPDWCPLVPVPEHGRLIDADALRQSINESIDECHKWANEVESGEMYARVLQSIGTFVECALRVKAAPTIIPVDQA